MAVLGNSINLASSSGSLDGTVLGQKWTAIQLAQAAFEEAATSATQVEGIARLWDDKDPKSRFLEWLGSNALRPFR